MVTTSRAAVLVLASALVLLAGRAASEEWSRKRIAALPDSAFAVVEFDPEGGKVRHLPHHDETGAVDPAHLRAARARLSQVKWLNPASEEIARQHLTEHERGFSRRD